MMPTPKGLLGEVNRILAPPTKLVKLDCPYNRLTKGASGKYVGDVVKLVGTTIGFNEPGLPGGRQLPVKAVQGNCAVASTMPGKILPTGDPIPGKALA